MMHFFFFCTGVSFYVSLSALCFMFYYYLFYYCFLMIGCMFIINVECECCFDCSIWTVKCGVPCRRQGYRAVQDQFISNSSSIPMFTFWCATCWITVKTFLYLNVVIVSLLCKFMMWHCCENGLTIGSNQIVSMSLVIDTACFLLAV